MCAGEWISSLLCSLDRARGCCAVVLLCCCSCVRRRGRLAELGGGWCVLVRAPGLADDSVREVRLAQVIVAVAVRLCEACRRPFWVGLVLVRRGRERR